MGVVLEVISDILELDRAVVYLRGDDGLQPAAGIDPTVAGGVVGPEELQRLSVAPARQAAFARGEEALEPVHSAETDPPFALVPILRDDDLLGLIEADNGRSGRPITEDGLQTLASFALQAAVAIHDAQVRQDPEAWQDQLDEVLQLDREAPPPDELEKLSNELDG